MVCEKCLEKRRQKGDVGVIVSDRDKVGATNYGPARSGGALDKRVSTKEIHNPYTKGGKERNCKICKDSIVEGHYCKDCSFKKGICSLCGKKVVDTTLEYKSTNA